jgi:hypothetical protein
VIRELWPYDVKDSGVQYTELFLIAKMKKERAKKIKRCEAGCCEMGLN